MSLLSRAITPRATKGIDQEAMSRPYDDARYVAIENLQRWTGLGISPDLAFNVINVYQCVRLIAETFASVPLILYRRLPDGGKERATDHELYDVFQQWYEGELNSYLIEITRDILGYTDENGKRQKRPTRIQLKDEALRMISGTGTHQAAQPPVIRLWEFTGTRPPPPY